MEQAQTYPQSPLGCQLAAARETFRDISRRLKAHRGHGNGPPSELEVKRRELEKRRRELLNEFALVSQGR